MPMGVVITRHRFVFCVGDKKSVLALGLWMEIVKRRERR
jgi:hypothetical protein